MRQILLFIIALLFSNSSLANVNHSMPNTVDGCAQAVRILLMNKIHIPVPINIIQSQRPAHLTIIQ